MSGENLAQPLSRGLRIIEEIGRSDDGLSLQAVADLMGLKRPTADKLLRTLAAHGFVERCERPVRYRLGWAVLLLGNRWSDRSLLRAAEREMRMLSSSHRDAQCVLAEAVGVEVVAVLRADGTAPGYVDFPRAHLLRSYTTAAGVVFQAHWPDERRAEHGMRYPFWEHGAEAWESPEDFEAALAEVRRAGYAVVDLARNDRFDVAAPVFRAGELRAAVSLSTPAAALDEEQRHACVRDVRAAAGRLSEKPEPSNGRADSSGARAPAGELQPLSFR